MRRRGGANATASTTRAFYTLVDPVLRTPNARVSKFGTLT
jgi:hypothetical protein